MLVEADRYAVGTIGPAGSRRVVLGGQAVLRLRAGQRPVLPAARRRHDRPLPDRPKPETVFEVIDRHQPTVFYSVPTSYAAMLHLAEKTGRTSLGRVPHVRLGRRTPAAAPVRKVAGPVRRRDPRRHRLDRDPAHLHLEPARPGQGRAAPARSCRATKPRSSTRTGIRFPRVPWARCGSRATASPPATGTSTSRPRRTFHGHVDQHPRQVLIDEDGFFWYAGRTDDMIKVSGQAVWPTDVEAVLQGHPAVLESGVVGATGRRRADQAGGLRRA